MGRLDRGLLGGYTGRLGTTVGATWKGIDVIRTYQPNVANPRTDRQVEHRSRFSAWTKLASSLLVPIVKPLWDRNAKRMSGYNAFIRANMDNTGKLDLIVPERFILSQGKMGVVDFKFAPDTLPDEIELIWDTEESPVFSSADDKLFAVVFVGDQVVAITSGNYAREEGGALFKLPQGVTSGTFTIVAAFQSADGRIQSNSSSIEIFRT